MKVQYKLHTALYKMIMVTTLMTFTATEVHKNAKLRHWDFRRTR
jgi:hypothetical protein